MKKEGSKHVMLNKIFGKHFTVFNVFAHTTANFIKLFPLPSIRTIHIHTCLLHSLFLLFVVFCLFLCLFACLFVCLFLCLCSNHVIIASSMSFIFVLCFCLCFCSYWLAFCTIILV